RHRARAELDAAGPGLAAPAEDTEGAEHRRLEAAHAERQAAEHAAGAAVAEQAEILRQAGEHEASVRSRVVAIEESAREAGARVTRTGEAAAAAAADLAAILEQNEGLGLRLRQAGEERDRAIAGAAAAGAAL